ncbi:MAG: hypothetical protein A3G26_05425 [Betaproteobacteria bacterium RIFCSPLOWO2_12_FULL_65_110]|nr:MAG: hypothetical protein A3G26_05425 [Betaproteobacteria bacterium RIFCSPLOWO2_12_FULL_65_110]
MIRRLNYTGRKKIARSNVTVRLLPAGGGHYAFEIGFDLRGYGFPDDATVFVEVYNSASYMRFAFGTVAERRDPGDVRLLDITSRPLPKFRLKVVDQSERHGLLLGVADKLIPLRPKEDIANKQSLLPVDFCDLGEVIWRLDLSDWPVLELNNNIDAIGEVARSGDSFLALVYPEVVRRILHEILIEQDLGDPEFDDSEWTSLWLRYVCSLPGVSEPPSGASEEARARSVDWIDGAVQAFCRSKMARRRFESSIEKESGWWRS